MLASLLRLGFVANFISEPVLIGFKAGIGLVIVLDQVPKLLGIHFPKGSFFHNLLAIVQAIPDASMPTLAVGIVMMVRAGRDRALPPAGAGAAHRGGQRDRRVSLFGLAGLWRGNGRPGSAGLAVLHLAGLLAGRAALARRPWASR